MTRYRKTASAIALLPRDGGGHRFRLRSTGGRLPLPDPRLGPGPRLRPLRDGPRRALGRPRESRRLGRAAARRPRRGLSPPSPTSARRRKASAARPRSASPFPSPTRSGAPASTSSRTPSSMTVPSPRHRRGPPRRHRQGPLPRLLRRRRRRPRPGQRGLGGRPGPRRHAAPRRPGVLKDLRWGAVLSRHRQALQRRDPSIPFTLSGGIRALIVRTKDWKIGVGADISLPELPGPRLRALRGRLASATSSPCGELEPGPRASSSTGSDKSLCPPSASAPSSRSSAAAPDSALAKQGWDQAELQPALAAAPLYGGIWALGGERHDAPRRGSTRILPRSSPPSRPRNGARPISRPTTTASRTPSTSPSRSPTSATSSAGPHHRQRQGRGGPQDLQQGIQARDPGLQGLHRSPDLRQEGRGRARQARLERRGRLGPGRARRQLHGH